MASVTYDEWAHRNDRGAIQADSGSVEMLGCDLRQASPHITLAEGMRRALITTSLFKEPAQIENRSRNDVQNALAVA
jgi:hypothetical protein